MDLQLVNYDLNVANGDFSLVDGDNETQQHVQLLLINDKGSIRQDPLCGVGLPRYQSAPIHGNGLELEINTQLEREGLSITVSQDTKTGELTFTDNG